ncbi:hypothetical protein AK812_SmicGene6430 [Symbiodinium microadriaticum]|uniref:Uncharacterized protein n=1 Tax=Symbiodinium microadriaticum TaxID=2951 RepID=A0A1Q9ER62_SYMMI|nr:hypothetical protein AK812_SmicGene6430 [Symbiodinium microadriaticum]
MAAVTQEAMDHVAPRANAFRKFMADVCETVCLEFEREVREMSEDILMYRGELARCADLLAFQLGKEKQYHNMLENIAENTSVLIGKSSELGQKHDAHEPLREQMNQIMDVIMNTHKDVNAGHGAVHQDHRQMVESHLMTSAQLQNQAAAVQAELDNIMKVLNVPVVGYTKAPVVPSPAAPVKSTGFAPYTPPRANNPQSPGMSVGSPGSMGSPGGTAGKKPLGASPTRVSQQGASPAQTMAGYGARAGVLWTDFLGDELIEFDTMNPAFQEVSTNLLKYWIAYADIDGLRLSSVGFMSADFTAFLSTHLRRYATKLGKEQFFMIGEVDLSPSAFNTWAQCPDQTPSDPTEHPWASHDNVTSSKISPAEFFQSQIYLKAQEVQRDIANVADVRPRLLSVSTSPGDDDLHSWRILYAAWSLTWRGIPEIWYGAEQYPQFGFTGLCYANDAERKELLDRMVAAKISATVAEDRLKETLSVEWRILA